jgi:hypothetical protein
MALLADFYCRARFLVLRTSRGECTSATESESQHGKRFGPPGIARLGDAEIDVYRTADRVESRAVPFATGHAVAYDRDHEIVLGITKRDRRLMSAVTERAP